MKILSVHNSYQNPGGEDQVFAQETDLLRSHGHQVLVYHVSNDEVSRKNPLVLLAIPSGTSKSMLSFAPSCAGRHRTSFTSITLFR